PLRRHAAAHRREAQRTISGERVHADRDVAAHRGRLDARCAQPLHAHLTADRSAAYVALGAGHADVAAHRVGVDLEILGQLHLDVDARIVPVTVAPVVVDAQAALVALHVDALVDRADGDPVARLDHIDGEIL